MMLQRQFLVSLGQGTHSRLEREGNPRQHATHLANVARRCGSRHTQHFVMVSCSSNRRQQQREHHTDHTHGCRTKSAALPCLLRCAVLRRIHCAVRHRTLEHALYCDGKTCNGCGVSCSKRQTATSGSNCHHARLRDRKTTASAAAAARATAANACALLTSRETEASLVLSV